MQIGMNAAPLQAAVECIYAVPMGRLARRQSLVATRHVCQRVTDDGYPGIEAIENMLAAVQESGDFPFLAMCNITLHLLKNLPAPAARPDDEHGIGHRTDPPSITKLVPVTQRLASDKR